MADSEKKKDEEPQKEEKKEEDTAIDEEEDDDNDDAAPTDAVHRIYSYINNIIYSNIYRRCSIERASEPRAAVNSNGSPRAPLSPRLRLVPFASPYDSLMILY